MANDVDETAGYVSGIKRFMLNDGPGIRTVVFLQGCGLRCVWCSSPHTWSRSPKVLFLENKCIGCGRCFKACGYHAIDMKPAKHRVQSELCTGCGACVTACPPKALKFNSEYRTVQSVANEVMLDSQYFEDSGGGVTVSGGEPALQPGFTAELLRCCKAQGINTLVETCSFASWDNMRQVAEYADFMFCDIKHMDTGKHKELTGQGNETILNNIKRLVSELHKDITVSLPLIPGCNDDMQNLADLAVFMKESDLKKINILPFHKLGEHEYKELGMEYKVKSKKTYSKEQIKNVVTYFENNGIKVANNPK